MKLKAKQLINRNHYVQSSYEHIIKKNKSMKWQGVVHTEP